MLLVVAGSALGAPARYAVSRLLNRLGGFPWGTLAVNVTGAAVLGVLVASGTSAHPSPWRVFAVAGCGAFTTYSAFAVETVQLGRLRGTLYAAVTVVAGIGAAELALRLY